MIDFNNPYTIDNLLEVKNCLSFYRKELEKNPNNPLTKQAVELFEGYKRDIEAHLPTAITRYVKPCEGCSPIIRQLNPCVTCRAITPPQTKMYTMTGFEKVEIKDGKTKLPDLQPQKPLPITRSIKEKAILKPKWNDL